MDKNLWNLFKTTGDLRYYILLRKLEQAYEDIESKRDSSTRY